jgi:hypothetical protein
MCLVAWFHGGVFSDECCCGGGEVQSVAASVIPKKGYENGCDVYIGKEEK